VRPAFDQGANEALVAVILAVAGIAVALITTGVGFASPAISGDVTCLAADGDRAVVGGRLNEGEFAGSGWLMQLDDRGRPAAATRDRVSPVFLLLPEEEPAGFPRRCPSFDDAIFGDIGLFSQTYGDVALVDE
jgi:hypothetical protein